MSGQGHTGSLYNHPDTKLGGNILPEHICMYCKQHKLSERKISLFLQIFDELQKFS